MSIASTNRIRAKLERPMPSHAAGTTNSSQVRRLLVRVMYPHYANQRNFKAIRLGASLVFVAVLTAGTAIMGSWLSHRPAAPAHLVTTDLPERKPLRFMGTMVPSKKSDLAFTRTGRIKRILVKEGDVVEAGTVLAEIESDLIEAELEVARSEQKLALNPASLIQRQPYSTRRMGHATTDYATNTSSWRTTSPQRMLSDHWSAVVHHLELQLEQCKLRAPYRCLITQVHKFDGGVTSSEQPVAKIVSHEEITARFSLPARYADHLRNQESMLIQVGEQHLRATLQGIVPEGEGSLACTAIFSMAGLTATDLSEPVTLILDLPTTLPSRSLFRSVLTAKDRNKGE